MPFSRRHYRLVSPAEPTPRDVAIRFAESVWLRVAILDRERAYPVTTRENFAEAVEFERCRYLELARAAGLR